MKQMHLPFRNMIYGFMMLLLFALLPILAQKGLASAYHFKSNFYLAQWQSGVKPTQLQYDSALFAADYASSIENKNPHYLLTLAKVMEWGVFADFSQTNKTAFSRLYLEAISQRPNWPNAYSDYAYNLAFIQKDIVQAWPYLAKALHYGPYAPEVLHQTLAIGFAYWSNLTLLQKTAILSQAHVAASGNWQTRNNLKKLASQYKLTHLLCSYFTNAESINTNIDKWVKQDMCR